MKRGLLLVAALFMVAGTASGDLLHHWPLTEDGEDVVGTLHLTIVGEIADGALQCADKLGAWGEGGNCFQTDSTAVWTLTYEIQTELTSAWVMGRVQEGATDVEVTEGGKSFLLGFYDYMPGQPTMDDSWNNWIGPDDEAAAVNSGDWQHVGISHTGDSNIAFWVDGTFISEGEFPGGLQDSTENEGINDFFNIAGCSWMPTFVGAIRNVRYFDEVANGDLIDGSMGPPPPPPAGVVIGGDTHRKEVTDDLSLSIELTNIEAADAVQWGKDGEPLEGETGDTLTVLDLTTDDSGTYDVVVTYTPVEEGGDAAYDEVSDEFYVMVFPLGEAPLAGGLGLGLLAGACALAGAVAIRRKK